MIESRSERRGLKTVGLAAGALAGLALYNRALQRRIERTWPPRGRFVEIDGAILHYVEGGRGRPVVLLHGASGTLNDFLPVLFGRVARHYRAIAFDRPGHGYSTRRPGPASPARQAAYLRDALRALRIEQPILVGHSWSSALVLAYASAWPGEIAGIVTIAGVSHPWTGNYISWYNRAAAHPVLGPLFVHTLLVALGQALIGPGVRHVFAPEPPIPGYARHTGLPLMLRPQQFRANALDLIGLNAALAEQAPHYRDIRVPAGIVAPTMDRRIVDVKHHSRKLYEEIPNARLFVADGAGHMPHHTQPGVVMQAIDWVAVEACAVSRPRDRSA
jgi:pimeloyl-ACP methyl ester carboxylesterase